MSMPDSYAEWDAAYVLGALSPAERHAFEEHLAGCARCRGAVAELAAMPGLLAQVPISDALSSDLVESEPMPQFIAPAMPPSRRARTAVGVAIAVLALILAAVGGFWVRGVVDDPPEPAPSASSFRLAFTAVVPSQMTAVIDIAARGPETDLQVECQYAAGSYPGSGEADYSIYVVDRTGRATLLKTWTAKPGKVMHPGALAPLPVAEIQAIEIRAAGSEQILMQVIL